MHWEDILDQILIRECGHDPSNPDGRVVDTGGLTRFGIAESSGMSKEGIESLTRETAREWYTANIWEKIKKCPPHLHYILADMWTNYGPRGRLKSSKPPVTNTARAWTLTVFWVRTAIRL